MFPLRSHLLLVFLAMAAAAATGCGGESKEPDRAGAGSGGSAGGTSITVPNGGGETMEVSSAGAGDGDPNQPALSGPAFFDLDCGQNGALPPPDTCAQCERTQCEAQFAAALGSEWTNGRADGPCRAWFDCIQACECNDQACYRTCTGKLGEGSCAAAFSGLDSCVQSDCKSACSSSSNG